MTHLDLDYYQKLTRLATEATITIERIRRHIAGEVDADTVTMIEFALEGLEKTVNEVRNDESVQVG